MRRLALVVIGVVAAGSIDAQPPSPEPGRLATARQLLGRHVDAARRFRLDDRTLVDTSARSCARLLQRRVAVDVSEHFFPAAVVAFNAATGRNIPIGSVGTCGLGAVSGTSERVRVRQARTLGAALDEIVGQVAGVAWLAVEATDGRCAVGLYSRDTLRPPAPPRTPGSDLFCAVQIAVAEPQPVRPAPRRR